MNVLARPWLLFKVFKAFNSFGVAVVVVASSSFLEAAQTEAGPAEAIRSLEWRSIGPANMGGRVTAVVGIPGDAKTLWVAGADGGLWKTINAGVTFEGQFQNEAAYSVGAIALAPSDINVLWLGSGEGDPRNSTSYGNGVYRSTDAGRTWKHLGLDDTERIKRIAVHPSDPDTAYVCALGHAWGANAERGVFKTIDGGESWEKVLYIDEDTGCSDIDMDLSNPRILYAGMWTHRRRPWRFDSGSTETALYKTTDGGATWEKKTEGLPKGPMDRIGVAVAQSRTNIVYLVTEAADEGTLFRSEDWGESWKMVHEDARINFRPFYYSDIRVDPTNPEVVYSLSGRLYKSTDGGRTFKRIANGVHGDHQAFWIDPEDSDRLLSGSDGGYQVSFDAGANWDIINNVVLAQFYHVFIDDRDPDYVCGGLQDNGNWCSPSRTGHAAGILKDDWYTVSGGDGFYAVPIPGQPHLIYSNSQGGPINITDTRSGNTRRIHPRENDLVIGTHGRGAWILDDASPLQELAEAMETEAYLFDIRPAARWQSWRRGANLGQRTFVAENPPTGALINFYTQVAPSGPVRIEVRDASGELVRSWEERDVEAGVHRAVWNLTYDAPTPMKSQEGDTGFFAQLGRQGPTAVPGEYDVTVKIDGKELTHSVVVEADPRVTDVTQADYETQLVAALALRELTSRVHGLIDSAASLHSQLEHLEDILGDSEREDAELQIEAVGTALQEVEALENKLQRPIPGLGYRQYPRIREELRSLTRAINVAAARPSEPQLARLETLKEETRQVVEGLDRLLSMTIRDVNNMLGAYPNIFVDTTTPDQE